MDTGETFFSINPTNFPAKLWQLVNNPTITVIHWDSSGEHVVIEQNMFEKQFLDPEKKDCDSYHFKTNNFASFIRQLNLYGFRKVTYNKLYHSHGVHHYRNPNFKQGHPERLELLKRLTVSNKAKIEAGIEVPSRRHRVSCGENVKNKYDKTEIVETKGVFHPAISHPTREYKGTPVPPRNWMIHKGTPSPQMFYTKSGIPIPVFSRYSGEASASSLAHIQQGYQGYASPGPEFSTFIPQYPSGFYSGFQYHPQGPMSFTGCSHQTAPYSHLRCYQPNYPISRMFPGNHCQDSQGCEFQNMKRNDINLDTVFQLVDELDEGCLQSHVVKVDTPEKPVCKPPTSMNSIMAENPSANSMLAFSSHADTSVESAIKQMLH